MGMWVHVYLSQALIVSHGQTLESRVQLRETSRVWPRETSYTQCCTNVVYMYENTKLLHLLTSVQLLEEGRST